MGGANQTRAVSSRDLPIIFSAGAVNAIMDGRKSQTRRLVRRPSKWCDRCWTEAVEHNGRDAIFGGPCYLRVAFCEHNDLAGDRVGPRWMPGDWLWVRETWAEHPDAGEHALVYRASDTSWDDEPGSIRWRSPIHMPRRFSRISLEVENVRVQRLQDISREDARAEGVSSRERFRYWWGELHGDGKDGWEMNPWVWALTFKRIWIKGSFAG